jgi:hypothetical protein
MCAFPYWHLAIFISPSSWLLIGHPVAPSWLLISTRYCALLAPLEFEPPATDGRQGQQERGAPRLPAASLSRQLLRGPARQGRRRTTNARPAAQSQGWRSLGAHRWSIRTACCLAGARYF